MAHLEFLAADMDRGLLYDLLVTAVSPRPIGFISTVDREGKRNLAPYSFFMVGGLEPPSLVFCPSNMKSGLSKDSLRNVEETGEFVVNIVTRSMAEPMNQTALDYPAGHDEWRECGFTPAASVVVRAPRVQESPVSFECKLFQIIRHGEGPHGTNYVIGEVVAVHTTEDILQEGKINRAALRTIGRMGGNDYVDLAAPEIFELERPKPRA